MRSGGNGMWGRGPAQRKNNFYFIYLFLSVFYIKIFGIILMCTNVEKCSLLQVG